MCLSQKNAFLGQKNAQKSQKKPKNVQKRRKWDDAVGTDGGPIKRQKDSEAGIQAPSRKESEDNTFQQRSPLRALDLVALLRTL